MPISDNIKRLREERELTQKQLGDLLKVSDKAVSTWERGSKTPRMGVIQKLADFFRVPISELFGTAAIPEVRAGVFVEYETREIPILNELPEAMYVSQESERTVRILRTVQADFALYCTDEGFAGPNMRYGDVVLLRKRSDAESGKIAAVSIDGEILLRRYYRYTDKLVLVADNPAVWPQVYIAREMERVKVLGQVVARYEQY